MTIRISNLGDFASGLDKEMQELEKLVTRETRGIAIGVLARLVDMSPVDTGRFRGNWQVEIGRDPTAELPDKDKSGNPTKEKGTATVKGCPPFQPVYIANNLPYGPTLNDGHSKQAPAGFVEIAVDQVVSPFQ